MHSKDEIIDLVIAKSPNLSWIKSNLLYLTLYGSRAYDLENDESDYDYRGITSIPKEYLYGFVNSFEQVLLYAPEPDTQIYNVIKFFKLASDCNPSVIEILFTDSKDQMFIHPHFQEVLDNKEMFLSKRARYSFSGYAFSQLKKLNLHRTWLINPQEVKPNRSDYNLPEQTQKSKDMLDQASALIRNDIEKNQLNFLEYFEESEKILIKSIYYNSLSEMKILKDDQWINSGKKIGFDDNLLEFLLKEKKYRHAIDNYNSYQTWKKTRNPKRAILEAQFGYDTKNATALVRLIKMAKEIMTDGKVIVKRPDREELLDIKNGKWSYEQLIEFADNSEKELNEMYVNCKTVPNKPNLVKIDKILQSVVEKML